MKLLSAICALVALLCLQFSVVFAQLLADDDDCQKPTVQVPKGVDTCTQGVDIDGTCANDLEGICRQSGFPVYHWFSEMLSCLQTTIDQEQYNGLAHTFDEECQKAGREEGYAINEANRYNKDTRSSSTTEKVSEAPKTTDKSTSKSSPSSSTKDDKTTTSSADTKTSDGITTDSVSPTRPTNPPQTSTSDEVSTETSDGLAVPPLSSENPKPSVSGGTIAGAATGGFAFLALLLGLGFLFLRKRQQRRKMTRSDLWEPDRGLGDKHSDYTPGTGPGGGGAFASGGASGKPNPGDATRPAPTSTSTIGPGLGAGSNNQAGGVGVASRPNPSTSASAPGLNSAHLAAPRSTATTRSRHAGAKPTPGLYTDASPGRYYQSGSQSSRNDPGDSRSTSRNQYHDQNVLPGTAYGGRSVDHGHPQNQWDNTQANFNTTWSDYGDGDSQIHTAFEQRHVYARPVERYGDMGPGRDATQQDLQSAYDPIYDQAPVETQGHTRGQTSYTEDYRSPGDIQRRVPTPMNMLSTTAAAAPALTAAPTVPGTQHLNANTMSTRAVSYTSPAADWNNVVAEMGYRQAQGHTPSRSLPGTSVGANINTAPMLSPVSDGSFDNTQNGNENTPVSPTAGENTGTTQAQAPGTTSSADVDSGAPIVLVRTSSDGEVNRKSTFSPGNAVETPVGVSELDASEPQKLSAQQYTAYKPSSKPIVSQNF